MMVNRRTGLVVACVLLAGAGLGFATIGLHDQGLPAIAQVADVVGGAFGFSGVEEAWAGGGSSVLFEDDMARETAEHYGSAPFGEGTYYGGAVPTRVDGAERWQHEDHRWGTEMLRGDVEAPWRVVHEGIEGLDAEGFWRFGNGMSVEEASYPGGVVAGVVSPTIDLSGVRALEEQRVEGDTGLSWLYPRQPDDQVSLPTPYRDATDGGRFAASEDPGEFSMGLATAALELSHAYAFDELGRSGGRVEVSINDPLHGWTSWEGLEPTHQRLVIAGQEGEAELRAEVPTPTINQVVLDPSDPEGMVDADVEDQPFTVRREGDPVQGTTSASGDAGHPGLYRGLVGASTAAPGGPWDGFVLDSHRASSAPEEVVSVFDLSSYAGYEIKLRFMVASTGTVGDVDEHQGLGWALNHVTVHATGEDDVEILGMPHPGDGAVVNTTVTPAIALLNTGPERRLVDVHWNVDGDEAVTEGVSLQTGPSARTFLTSPLQTQGGLSDVDVRVIDAERPPVTNPEESDLARDTFHVLEGPGGGLDVVDVLVFPIEDGEPSDQPERFLFRGQPAVVQVDVQNLGSGPLSPALMGEDADLQPLLVDRRGQPVGGFEPHADSQGEVLPPSRSTSGTLGEEDPVRTLNWTWEGAEEASVLELSIEDAEGEALFEAGRVLVDDVPASPMDLAFDNMDTFLGSCDRLQRFGDREGVARCMEDGVVQTPVVPVTDGRLSLGGSLLSGSLFHQGGPAEMVVWFQEVPGDPGDVAPEAGTDWADWTKLGVASFDASDDWNVSKSLVLEPDPPAEDEDVPADLGDRTGWLFANVSAAEQGSPVSVDEVILDLLPDEDEDGGSAGFELLHRTFEGTVQPHRTIIQDPQGSGIVQLTGVDSWTERTDVSSQVPVEEEVELEGEAGVGNIDAGSTGLSTNGSIEAYAEDRFGDDILRVRSNGTTHKVFWDVDGSFAGQISRGEATVEDGDLHFPKPSVGTLTGSTADFTWEVPTGRLAEDAVLRLPGGPDGTYTLDGVRPTLTFDHWHELGPGGIGVVEVRPVDAQGAPAAWDRAEDRADQTPSARHHLPSSVDGWYPVAAFEGRSQGDALIPVQVPLDAFVGETVEVQLRYHLDPDLDINHLPTGWIVGNLALTVQGEQGHASLYDSGDDGHEGFEELEDDGLVHGGHVASAVDATRMDRDEFPWPSMDPPRVTGFRAEQLPFGPPEDADKHDRAWSLISDPLDLRASQRPLLTIDHHGQFRTGTRSQSFVSFDAVCEAPMVGLEYRLLEDDGSWPATWTRAVEHRANDLGVSHANLRDPQGDVPGAPFNRSVPFDRVSNGHDLSSVAGTTEFDLSPLTGEIAQLRWTVWAQHPTRAPTDDCETLSGFGDDVIDADWTIGGIRVGEDRHVVDTTVDDVRFLTDDAGWIRQRDPGLLGDEGEVVFADDEVFVSVNVTNRGIIPVDAEVALGVMQDDGGAELRVQAQKSERATQELEGFEPGETKEIVFRVVAGNETHVPAEYTATATVEPTDARDRVPENNEATVDVRVLPVRNLRVDAAASGVHPPIAAADDAREVVIELANLGNVLESNVAVSGHLVEFVGLDPVDRSDVLTLEAQAAATEPEPLPKRGDGSKVLSWSFNETVMEEAGLVPGRGYGFILSMTVGDDSFDAWWAPEGQQEGLRDVTDPEPILLRFTPEQELYRTDLSRSGVPGDKVSAVERAYPSHTEVLDAWATTTLLDGEPISEQEDVPEEVPTWELVDTGEVDLGFDGHPTHQAWFLDAYDGFENITHILESPPLPGHVVDGASTGILDLTYASTVTHGNALVETRTYTQGEWTPWTPIADQSTQRVAVVVPPDFPYVTGSQHLHPGIHAYDDSTPWGEPDDGHHPRPPFYFNPGEHPDITAIGGGHPPASCGTSQGDCAWTPFPHGEPTYDDQWVQALDVSLLTLAHEVGIENVGLFTLQPGGDLSSDFALNGVTVSEEPGDLPRYVTTLHGQDWAFPIEDLSKLGERLGSYGSILVVGDNTTKVLADKAPSLAGMTYYDEEAMTLDEAVENAKEGTFLGPSALAGHPVGVEYHRVLSGILQAAPDYGVGLIGAAGPAVASVAQTDAAQGATVSVPTFNRGGLLNGEAFARCTGPWVGGHAAPQPDQPQPHEACAFFIPPQPGTPGHWALHDSPNNYEYFPPDAAQKLAIRELAVGGQASLAGPGVEVDTADTGLTIVTASQPGAAAAWVQTVLGHRVPATGILPSGDWRTLPPTFTSPVGGGFDRNATGHEVFDGRPTQLRVLVEADLAQRGHGAFALDRLDAFGTPRDDAALGVEIAHPDEGAVYHPSRSFDVEVELTNLGATQLKRAGHLVDLTVDVDSEACDVPSTTRAVHLDRMLDPGTSTTVLMEDVLASGMPSCPEVDDRHQDIEVTVTATVVDAQARDENVGYEDTVTFEVRQVDRVNIDSYAVTPALVEQRGDNMTVEAVLVNNGNRPANPQVTLVLEHARPWMCAAGQDAFGCRYDDGEPVAVDVPAFEHELATFDEVPILSPGESGTAATTFDTSQVPPGIYRLSLTVETTIPGPTVVHEDRVEQRVFFVEEGFGLDGARPYFEANLTAEDHVSDADLIELSNHGNLQGQHPQDGQGQQSHSNFHTHDGSYGPDPETRYTDPITGQQVPLEHGWRPCPDCDDDVFQWQRANLPSWNADGTVRLWEQVGSQQGRPSIWGLGHADFGPDGFEWPVLPVNDPVDPTPGEYVTLASFEDPKLVFETRGITTENTALIVQMRMPQLGGCDVIGGNGGPRNEICRTYWDWTTPWFTLRTHETGPGPDVSSNNAEAGTTGNAAGGPDTHWLDRVAPSHPFGGTTIAGIPNVQPPTVVPNGFTLGYPDPNPAFQSRWHQPQCQSPLQGGINYCSYPLMGGEPQEGLWGSSTPGMLDGDWRTLVFDLTSDAQGTFTTGQQNSQYAAFAWAPQPIPEDRLDAYCQQVSNRFSMGSPSQGANAPPIPNMEAGIAPDPCRYVPFPSTSTISPGPGRGHGWNPNNGAFFQKMGDVDEIARPVQFRVLAASYGGDEGASFFEVRNLALTDYDLSFVGPDVIERQGLMDAQHEDLPGDPEILPVRIENTGPIEDAITLSWRPEGDATSLRSADVDLGLTPRFEDASDELTLHLGPGEGTIVWVRIQTEIPFLVDPGVKIPIPFLVEAHSQGAPIVSDSVLVDAAYERRAWGDLDLRTLALDDSTDRLEPFAAAEGQRVDVTVVFRNDGQHAVGSAGDVVPVQLVAERLDPENGTVLDTGVVDEVEIEAPVQPFSQTAEETFVEMEWVPDEQGVFSVRAVVNGDAGERARLAEASYHNNELTRPVTVGPFELADLQITDAWLVPFRDGCQAEEPVSRAIAGHAYCVAARVENLGRTGALSPEVTFSRLGEGFSAPSLEDHFPDNVFPGGEVAVVASSPWQAQQRLGEEPWPFQVSVTSDSPMATFENKTVGLEVRVDRYDLVLVDAPDALTLVPGERAEVEVTLRNRGSAPATPTVRIMDGASTLQVQASEGTTILPSEEDRLVVEFTASRGLRTEAALPAIEISTVEDRRVAVPLGLSLSVADTGTLDAEVLPRQAPPGATSVDVVLDNQESSRSTQWRAVAVTGPIAIAEDDWVQRTDAFETRVVSLPVTIDGNAAPSRWNATLALEATQEDLTRRVSVPLVLDVDPAARVDAWLAEASAFAIPGQPTPVAFSVQNTGNVPVDVRMSSQAEAAHITEGTQLHSALVAGDTHNATVLVTPERSDPSLGQTQIEWRATGSEGGWEQGPQLSWSIDYEPAQLRLVETTLSTVDPEPGRSVTVDVVVQNRGNRSIDAELVSIVGTTAQGYTETTLPPGELVHESVSLYVPEDSEDETAWVILRPQGAQLGPADPLLYEVGDAVDASLVLEDSASEDGGLQATPWPSISVLIAVGLGSLLVRRTRRRT